MIPERISALLKRTSELWLQGNTEQSAMHLRIVLSDLDRLLTPIRRRGHEDRPPVVPADAFGREKVRLMRSSCAEALSLLHREPTRAGLMLSRAVQLSGLNAEPVRPVGDGVGLSDSGETWDIRYYGFDQTIRATIVETVRRLPASVARFVFDRCFFVSVGRRCWGIAMPSTAAEVAANRWLVVLNEGMPRRTRHSIVAREIAYAWLGHDRLSPICDPASDIQAEGLTAEWGFKGVRASAASNP